MSIEVRVPALPESIADARVINWHRQPGEPVQRDQALVDLETDKVVLEVPAPSDGVLSRVLFGEGETVRENDLLGVIDESAEKAASPAKPGAEPAPKASATTPENEEPAVSPAVRRLMREMKIDPAQIQGTGKRGRILKSDVMSYLDAQEKAQPTEEPEMGTISAQLERVPGVDFGSERPEQRVPMTRLRARVAERLVEAQRTAAILTTFNEVNLQAVSKLRRRYRDHFEKQHEVRLGFMSFFVKAAVEALQRFPVVNASVDGEDIVYHGYYDIGIAVSSPRGLVVPILRNCDQLSFAEIEKGIRGFGTKAQEGKLSYDDLTGGTFTISNGGVFGSMLSTPILNPPQSAILGMHTIQQRPVAEAGEVVIRPMMYLALSYDHRIIDGRDAVQFLVAIKETLEDPARLLLQI